jgi:translation initiation factor IF-3
VPVPRRFDRRPPERDTTRINERIRVPEVRLIDDEGNQIGVLKTPDALVFAQERDLDLVEVAPEARPPVCRVLDYSKYKYEQAQKVKQARKHQQQITVREIKFRPKIAEHDYDTKKHHVERFLKHKDKVKVTIMFRGREVTHPERGTMILDRLAEELAELGVVEQRPMQEGRNMTMMMAPSKAVLAGRTDAEQGEETSAETAGADSAASAPDAAAATPDGGASPESPAATPAADGPTSEPPSATETDATETDATETDATEADATEADATDATEAGAATPNGAGKNPAPSAAPAEPHAPSPDAGVAQAGEAGAGAAAPSGAQAGTAVP